MFDHKLDPPIIHMPDFGPGQWLNVERPLNKKSLRGQVVLVDFWDYACVNCIRTLPYIKRWHRRYADKGLTVVGVHTPEFEFGRDHLQVTAAIEEFGLAYPVLVDKRHTTWLNFANKAWPTKYLVDANGYIRFKRQGEGYYRETERAMQALLRQRDPDVTLPDLLPPLREEDTPGTVCYRPTPELYAGYQGGGLFGSALGNPDGYAPQNPVFYELPDGEEREEGQFYLDGIWRAWPESLAYAGQDGGKIALPYSAVTVNAVLSPTADPVETMLHLRPTEDDPVVELRQDGRHLTAQNAGADVSVADDGTSYIRVTRPRMYQLVKNSDYESHELELIFRASGLALYAFTFTTCVAPTPRDGQDVFRVK